MSEGTKTTTTQVLNIIQKVPGTVIYLKVDEEQWKIAQGSKEHEASGCVGNSRALQVPVRATAHRYAYHT